MTDTEGKVHALGRVTPVATLARDIPVPQALAKGSQLQAEKIRDTMKPFVPGVKAFLGNERKTLSELHTHMSTKPAFQTAIEDLNLKRAGGFLKSIRSMDSLQVETVGGQLHVRVRIPTVRKRLTGKQSPNE